MEHLMEATLRKAEDSGVKGNDGQDGRRHELRMKMLEKRTRRVPRSRPEAIPEPPFSRLYTLLLPPIPFAFLTGATHSNGDTLPPKASTPSSYPSTTSHHLTTSPVLSPIPNLVIRKASTARTYFPFDLTTGGESRSRQARRQKTRARPRGDTPELAIPRVAYHNVDPHHSRAARPPSPLPPLSCLFGTPGRTENQCSPPQTPPESTVSPSPSPRLPDHRDGRAHSAPPINILAGTADDGGQERYDIRSEWNVGREASPSGFMDHSDPSDIGPHSAVQESHYPPLRHVRQLRPRAATASNPPSYILASPRAISAAISLSEIKKRPRSQEIVKTKAERAPKRRRRN
ncbi:hypothetical protein SISSUDRAFT_1065783 [Sistotremastrum suecicum HHB10207 ss-3]|uniref:Uncharacterized protein n=1 Tax=Sistotremastrum suecicum HHB10207 ss-3 TaxID=1314776 RepID=A0A165Z2S5_9AGAM|nr:hypothetical protein SISSUDRAFT_1065783 [Sistotremastrum suecicum HHB10207 ss-3]